MKRKFYQIFLITMIFLSLPFVNFSQNLSLGTCIDYVFFTTTGAITSSGTSSLFGNIGTGAGAITNCGSPSPGNRQDIANDATTQATNDLYAVYNTLINMPATRSHAVTFGSAEGETILAGVYALGGATSVTGNLILDANHDPNARFIFLINGEFSTAAGTTITLINGSSPNNVYWVAKGGAINMATNTTIIGTCIAQGGAATMAADAYLDGRLLVYVGAITFGSGHAQGAASYSTLPVNLSSFTAVCKKTNIKLSWSTASEINNQIFTIEKSENGIIWQQVAVVKGNLTSTSLKNYSYTDVANEWSSIFYRLKQTDINGSFKYANTINVKRCEKELDDNLTVYPNPSTGIFSLNFNNNTAQSCIIEVVNSTGKIVYRYTGFKKDLNLSNQLPGVYYVRVHLNDKVLTNKLIIKY